MFNTLQFIMNSGILIPFGILEAFAIIFAYFEYCGENKNSFGSKVCRWFKTMKYCGHKRRGA